MTSDSTNEGHSHGHELNSKSQSNNAKAPQFFPLRSQTSQSQKQYPSVTFATLNNRNKLLDIIKHFQSNTITFATIQELTTISIIPDRDLYIRVIQQFQHIPNTSPHLASLALRGLAVVLNSCPEQIGLGGIHSTILPAIEPLIVSLADVCSRFDVHQSRSYLSALCSLLDALVLRNIHGIKCDVHSLETHLVRSGGDKVARYLLNYGKQALTYLQSGKSKSIHVKRDGSLAIFANVESSCTFDALYDNFMKIANLETRDSWYHGLVYLDCIIARADWLRFESFVLKSKLESNAWFIQGVCLRLKEIAVSHHDQVIRTGAFKFLLYISQKSVCKAQKFSEVVIKQLGFDDYSRAAAPEILTQFTKKPLKQSHVGEDCPAIWSSHWYSDPSGVLFKAAFGSKQNVVFGNNIQGDDIQRARTAETGSFRTRNGLMQRNIGSSMVVEMAPTLTLEKIQRALNDFYFPLKIQGVGGDFCDFDSHYLPVRIAPASEVRHRDRENLRTISNQKYKSNVDLPSIDPSSLFDSRTLRNGKEGSPKKILIMGRPGIGKTTFSKKLVDLFRAGQWTDRFNAVLLLPLANIKLDGNYNLNDLLRKFHFQYLDAEESAEYSKALTSRIRDGRILFVLDGLDEVIMDDPSPETIGFLQFLLGQNYVVVTTRPSGVDKSLLPNGLLPNFDLELEIVGFNAEQEKRFLEKKIGYGYSARDLDLAKQLSASPDSWSIPAVLDSYHGFAKQSYGIMNQGMMAAFLTMDSNRLRKDFYTVPFTTHSLLMSDEIDCLSRIAYDILDQDRIEFSDAEINGSLENINRERRVLGKKLLPVDMLATLKRTSFLHTADIGLDDNVSSGQKKWHFLTLMFRDLFAANWLSIGFHQQRHFSALIMPQRGTRTFFKDSHSPRLHNVLKLIASSLSGQDLTQFFEILMGRQSDLIGVYHRSLIAACYEEVSGRLDIITSTLIEINMIRWAIFEVYCDVLSFGVKSICRSEKNGLYGGLCRYNSFPEGYLMIIFWYSNSLIKYSIASALRFRRVWTNQTFEFYNSILTSFEDYAIRRIAVEALSSQAILPRSSLAVLREVLHDDDKRSVFFATKTLIAQKELPEDAMEVLRKESSSWVISSYWDFHSEYEQFINPRIDTDQSLEEIIENLTARSYRHELIPYCFNAAVAVFPYEVRKGGRVYQLSQGRTDILIRSSSKTPKDIDVWWFRSNLLRLYFPIEIKIFHFLFGSLLGSLTMPAYITYHVLIYFKYETFKISEYFFIIVNSSVLLGSYYSAWVFFTALFVLYDLFTPLFDAVKLNSTHSIY